MRIDRPPSTSLHALIGSDARVAVLSQLILEPDSELHLRELVRRTRLAPRSVSKEVDRLAEAGFLLERHSGNRRYLRANLAHPLYPALHEMLSKTLGVIPALRAALTGSPRIAFAGVFGSVAAGDARSDSDIDLLVIGPITLREVLEILEPVHASLRREINPIVMSEAEFDTRRKREEHFVTSILSGPMVPVVGSIDDAS